MVIFLKISLLIILVSCSSETTKVDFESLFTFERETSIPFNYNVDKVYVTQYLNKNEVIFFNRNDEKIYYLNLISDSIRVINSNHQNYHIKATYGISFKEESTIILGNFSKKQLYEIDLKGNLLTTTDLKNNIAGNPSIRINQTVYFLNFHTNNFFIETDKGLQNIQIPAIFNDIKPRKKVPGFSKINDTLIFMNPFEPILYKYSTRHNMINKVKIDLPVTTINWTNYYDKTLGSEELNTLVKNTFIINDFHQFIIGNKFYYLISGYKKKQMYGFIIDQFGKIRYKIKHIKRYSIASTNNDRILFIRNNKLTEEFSFREYSLKMNAN